MMISPRNYHNLEEEVQAEASAGTKDLVLQKALDWALAIDRDQARKQVAQLKERYPTLGREQLIQKMIARSRWWAAGWGAAAGIPVTVWVAAPAVLGNLAALLRVEISLAARIALLYESDYLASEEPPYELLVPIMGERMASETLRNFAVRGSMGVTRHAIKQVLQKETLHEFKKLMLKWFGMKVTQPLILARVLPVVGAVFGGTWNYVELKVVGNRVSRYFDGRDFE